MLVPLSPLVAVARWLVILIVGGLGVTVAVKLLTGQINTQYLLYGRYRDGTRYFSPERVQMLVATFAIAFQYLQNAYVDPGKMPNLPTGSLEILGLSHAVYLGGKSWMMFGATPRGQGRK